MLVTSTGEAEERIKNLASIAMSQYDPENKIYSAYLNGESAASTLTQDLISSLGEGAQNNIGNIRDINRIIKKYVNTNDLIGMVVQSISNNINSNYRLSYKAVGEKKKEVKTLEKAKMLVENFNDEVNIKRFIRNSILTTYLEGNYVAVLRSVNGGWRIDYYPLSIVENSGYEINGNPVILVNMTELRNMLTKTMLRTRSGQSLFFRDINEEVQNNYPKEVSDALASRETYAKLDDNYTGMVRINNFNGRYGLSPIFRALSPTLVLEDYQAADETNSKAKAKKIIHQKLRKEAMGQNLDKKAYDDMAFAHSQLMSAWRNKTVVITTIPQVESITYVEPKTTETPVDNINIYRNKVLSSLGVAFLAADKSQTASTANINLSQLMRCINSISEEVEAVIKHFYTTMLAENGIGVEYVPNIKVIDSEMLEMGVRMELAKLLYATFNSSRETAFDLLGIDIEDEYAKRELENTKDYDNVFMPRATSYNTKGYPTDPTDPNADKEAGRPLDTNSNDPEKQAYDQEKTQEEETI